MIVWVKFCVSRRWGRTSIVAGSCWGRRSTTSSANYCLVPGCRSIPWSYSKPLLLRRRQKYWTGIGWYRVTWPAIINTILPPSYTHRSLLPDTEVRFRPLIMIAGYVILTSLCGRDGCTICGPLCVPKSTYVTLAHKRKQKFFLFWMFARKTVLL